MPLFRKKKWQQRCAKQRHDQMGVTLFPRAKKAYFLCRAKAMSRSKVTHDDNNDNNRGEATVHSPFDKLQDKHIDRQLHEFRCQMLNVKCIEFWFFESIIWYY